MGNLFSDCWLIRTLLPFCAEKLSTFCGTQPVGEPELRSQNILEDQTFYLTSLGLMPSFLLPIVNQIASLVSFSLGNQSCQSECQKGSLNRMLVAMFSEIETTYLISLRLLRNSSWITQAELILLGFSFSTVTEALATSWTNYQPRSGNYSDVMPLAGLSRSFPFAIESLLKIKTESQDEKVIHPAVMSLPILTNATQELSAQRILLMRTPRKKHRILLAVRAEGQGTFPLIIVLIGMRIQSNLLKRICQDGCPLLRARYNLNHIRSAELAAELCLYTSQYLFSLASTLRWQEDVTPIVSRLWRRRSAKFGVASSWMPSRSSPTTPFGKSSVRVLCHSLMLSLGTKALRLKTKTVTPFTFDWLPITFANDVTRQLRLVGCEAGLASDFYSIAALPSVRK